MREKMEGMKKAQAALEFLTTYGWAFLVILTAIGALAYFGVLKVQPPDRCTIGPEFSCLDYRVTKDSGNTPYAYLVVANTKDFTMNVTQFTCSWDNEKISDWFALQDIKTGCNPDCSNNTDGNPGDWDSDAGKNWAPGEKRYVECSGPTGGGNLVVGEKTKVRFTITYVNQDVQGFEHGVEGEIVAGVQAR